MVKAEIQALKDAICNRITENVVSKREYGPHGQYVDWLLETEVFDAIQEATIDESEEE